MNPEVRRNIENWKTVVIVLLVGVVVILFTGLVVQKCAFEAVRPLSAWISVKDSTVTVRTSSKEEALKLAKYLRHKLRD